MAEIHKIPVSYYPDRQRKIVVEESTKVRIGSIIQWELRNRPFDSFYFNPLRFEVYFSGSSPFHWQVFAFQYEGFVEPFTRRNLLIAEGTAQTPGDYKYGLRTMEPGKDEPIYDEDPRLIIY